MNNLATTRLIRLALPAGLLLACSLLIWVTDADLHLARVVYGQDRLWPGIGRFPWNLLYDYAAAPALLLAGAAAGVLLASIFVKRLAGQRKQALFILLMVALGPGLLVNTLLKDHLGRARPIDVHEFGGDFRFTQFWQPGTSSLNKSFPSGHASIAFYLVAPWFILRRRRPAQAACWLAGGLGYGSLIGAGRILQGGHFLTDVLWAGGLIYLSGEVLAQVMALDRDPPCTKKLGNSA